MCTKFQARTVVCKLIITLICVWFRQRKPIAQADLGGKVVGEAHAYSRFSSLCSICEWFALNVVWSLFHRGYEPNLCFVFMAPLRKGQHREQSIYTAHDVLQKLQFPLFWQTNSQKMLVRKTTIHKTASDSISTMINHLESVQSAGIDEVQCSRIIRNDKKAKLGFRLAEPLMSSGSEASRSCNFFCFSKQRAQQILVLYIR